MQHSKLLSLLSFFAVLEEVMGSNSTTMTTTTSKLPSTVTVAGGSTKAPGGSNMSTTAAGPATKKVQGKVEYKVATMADCEKLKASTKYAEELCKKIVGWMGLAESYASKCEITTGCSTRRRLAEERRLAAVTVKSAFTVKDLTATQASSGSTNIAKVSTADLKSGIAAAKNKDPSLANITVSDVLKITKPTTTDTSSVDAAVALGFLSMVALAGVAHVF